MISNKNRDSYPNQMRFYDLGFCLFSIVFFCIFSMPVDNIWSQSKTTVTPIESHGNDKNSLTQQSQCLIENNNSDLRLHSIANQMVQNFNSGEPAKIKNKLFEMRTSFETIALEALQLEQASLPKMLQSAHLTIATLKDFKSFMPNYSKVIQTIRTQYIEPVENQLSQPMGYQDCSSTPTAPHRISKIKESTQGELNRIDHELFKAQNVNANNTDRYIAALEGLTKQADQLERNQFSNKLTELISEISFALNTKITSLTSGLQTSDGFEKQIKTVTVQNLKTAD